VQDRATIFLGPSMPTPQAQAILDAEYRPPVRRGDLEEFSSGAVVGIIDGVFEQDLAISPDEVHRALQRGVTLFGGSSMGALRAAEVPGVKGIGKVFEWYRDGIVTRDDEVALLFDPMMKKPLTVPTVCVRFAVDRLRSTGTLDATTARALLDAAHQLSFKERTYRSILAAANLDKRPDATDLIAMLKALDIKSVDAQAVLEAIDLHLQPSADGNASAPRPGKDDDLEANSNRNETLKRPADEVLIWETGDRVTTGALFEFLALSANIPDPWSWMPDSANEPDLEVVGQKAQSRFLATARRWGWVSSEEANVTLSDLGLDQDAVGAACGEIAMAWHCHDTGLRALEDETRQALRARMFLDDMSLKREAMRAATLTWFAERADRDPTTQERETARMTMTRLHGMTRFDVVRSRLTSLGFDDDTVAGFVDKLANARIAGRTLLDQMQGIGSGTAPGVAPGLGLGLGACPKSDGELRFCQPLEVAEQQTQAVADRIGITRIGMIGELGDLGSVQIAQAARPGNAWSSSYGSGKSQSRSGAVVGAVMEECEKWAQEQFDPTPVLNGSFRDLAHDGQNGARLVDPAELDLPHDSPYHPDLPLSWVTTADLISGDLVHIPRDLLVLERGRHDICFSARGARKHMATNGLGAGMALEEAVLHGLCELVERHAQRIAELFLSNPGGLGVQPYRFLDVGNVAPRLDDVMSALTPRADTIRVLEITCEITIPTYMAAIVRSGQVAHGFGTHPNPVVAIEAALLEAAQTVASSIAGGREDLSVRARSLGRHERPRPADPNSVWFWMDADTPMSGLDPAAGFRSDDVLTDLLWSLDRLRAAGLHQVLVSDLSKLEIAPARVARVMIPGLETNNPFHIGPRARLALLRDMLPRRI